MKGTGLTAPLNPIFSRPMNKPNLHPINDLAMSLKDYFVEVIRADKVPMIAGPVM